MLHYRKNTSLFVEPKIIGVAHLKTYCIEKTYHALGIIYAYPGRLLG